MKLRVVSSWTICLSLVGALALIQGQAQGQVVVVTPYSANLSLNHNHNLLLNLLHYNFGYHTNNYLHYDNAHDHIHDNYTNIFIRNGHHSYRLFKLQPPCSVAGVAALAIVVATTLICLRRRRRNNRDLTFDTLQGMSSPAPGRQRASQRYTANSLPGGGIGRDSSSGANGYDDGYEYDVAQSNAYGQHNGYGNEMYDAYGTPQQAYQNPSIFQEDSINYSTASSMGRNRAGFDQNLPEIVYRNGDLSHPSGGVTGYYDDDVYNQSGWNQGQAGGYIGPKGLWVANPTNENQQQQQQQQQYYQDDSEQPTQQQQEYEMTSQAQTLAGQEYEKNSVEPYDASETVVGSSSPHSKFLGHNPQALPESPRLQQLRSGDLFSQDSTEKPTSPRAANATANTTGGNTPPATSSSPRMANARDMRSFELARHSPGRSSGEGVHSYAHDLPTRPSVSDRPSMDSNVSGLNAQKSLRTHRREDWS
ncbi:hypothetical protein BGZ93_004438 [Podila epicladia]|nr:hypothetical protein BGZ93_004438 [Podila epicladia]